MVNYTAFDISLQVKVKQKYKLLNPVTVFTNSYQRIHRKIVKNIQKYLVAKNPVFIPLTTPEAPPVWM